MTRTVGAATHGRSVRRLRFIAAVKAGSLSKDSVCLTAWLTLKETP
jgi:hypothetical protein